MNVYIRITSVIIALSQDYQELEPKVIKNKFVHHLAKQRQGSNSCSGARVQPFKDNI